MFFSRISLRGKLGEAYEPYIFAALNSAKVMLAVGTCYEYYNAVWVKNEWSRYLKLCQADTAKHLIPCYRDIDPEDMPREFNHLQGADMGKMGAVQDILFNIEKYIPLKQAVSGYEKIVITEVGQQKISSLLDRFDLTYMSALPHLQKLQTQELQRWEEDKLATAFRITAMAISGIGLLVWGIVSAILVGVNGMVSISYWALSIVGFNLISLLFSVCRKR